MESWCLSKHKSSVLILFFMVIWIQGLHIEDERKALLEIKASLHELSNFVNVDNLLPTWVDCGTTNDGGYCNWERIKCNATTGYVTDLSLSNMFGEWSNEESEGSYPVRMIWPLNASLFLYFKELKSLDLSVSYIGNTFVSTGFERLSSLKKLEILNLSSNYIETDLFPLLSGLTSLKILDLSFVNAFQGFSPTHDIYGLKALENLEVLVLVGCGYYGTLPLQGPESNSTFRKLKILNLGKNRFNKTFVTSLSALTSLTTLDLQNNLLSGLFPSQELSNLTNLKKLDLTDNNLNIGSDIQGCKSLMRLKRLESVSLGLNKFNKSIISCLSFLPSLKILDLSNSNDLGSSFPMQELSTLRKLKTLDLSHCSFESLALNGTMSTLIHLNLGWNYLYYVDDIMRSMAAAFPSLRFLSLEMCNLRGRLFANDLEIPSLRDLRVLILGSNSFNGTLPMEALTSFQHLEVLDLSTNNFVGSIPSKIKLLTSLKVVSFADNKLNGSLPDHGFCELKNLEELDLSDNMFDGDLHECFNMLSSLKFVDISSNQFTGILLPSLIANLTSLVYVDFSHNKFEGVFSFSLFSNHTKLEVVEFISDNDKFEVETEEPIGWTPMFQLKILVLSNCNVNRPKENVLPNFLLTQNKLRVLDMSHNSMGGQFPNWLVKNNTLLDVVNMRNNSFSGNFSMPLYGIRIGSLDLSGNRMTGVISKDIQKFFPYIVNLNLSSNSLEGVIPSSIGDMNGLETLDLSHNQLLGEVPSGTFTNMSGLTVLDLSYNKLHGEVLSQNLSFGDFLTRIHLDSNRFTGNIVSEISKISTMAELNYLDISNNLFQGLIPRWVSNSSLWSTTSWRSNVLVVRNNRFEGQFPCGEASFSFLDISENDFSGPIPPCLSSQTLEHLHLGYNRFTGSIPNSFRNLSSVLTLDIGNNRLSGTIPEFLGEMSILRILLLRKNKFSGSIPKELCLLTNLSFIDLSSNSLSGSIPGCLKNITGPSYESFMQLSDYGYAKHWASTYNYHWGDLSKSFNVHDYENMFEARDEVIFTTKSLSLNYKGDILDIMSGLDLSCNKLTGTVPEELGLLTHIRVLNLSNNALTGPIPLNLSNLTMIESLDLSYNGLTGKVPIELMKLNFLSVFKVSYNNLSGRLPAMNAQFSTFTSESYEGNPLLCGPPLNNNCTNEPRTIHPSDAEDSHENWFDIDMTSFYGSSGATWSVVMLGFLAVLYVNQHWRRRWLDLVEECMYTCYYSCHDLVTKPRVLGLRL